MKAYCTTADNEKTKTALHDNYVKYVQPVLMSLYDLTERHQVDTLNSYFGKDVINDLNNNNFALSCFQGHGSPEGVQVNFTKNNRVIAILSLEGKVCHTLGETGNGINNWTNYNYPQISYSISCTLMPYDIYTEDNGYSYTEDNVPCNFGRSFTTHGLYGGPAFIGDTRPVYVVAGPQLQRDFFYCLKNFSNNISVAENYSKSNSLYRNIKLAHNILGCPDINIWTAIPAQLLNAEIVRRDNSVTCTTSILDTCYIGIVSLNGTINRIQVSTSNITLENISPNSSCVIYGKNIIPKFLPMALQNETVTQDNYIYTSSLAMGASIDTNRTSGNIIFDNCNLQFHVSGDVLIDAGFIARNSANIYIVSDGKVTIKGGSVANGASLHITSPSIEILRNFDVDSTSNISFNYK